MTQSASIIGNASVVVRPLVLERALWPSKAGGPGALALRPIPGTWHAHMDKSGHTSVVVPLVSCPACGGMLFIVPSQDTARVLGRMMGRIVPVAHKVSIEGKVSPDVRCMHGKCSFHKTLYLDKWDRLRPLYATAYVRDGSHKIEISYSHASSQKEARFHLGALKCKILGIGRAIGFFVDETTGRVTAD